MSNLKELGDDVILAILVHLDIPTVLSLTQTCQYFHSLVFTNKSLWLVLLSDVQSRISVDLPSGHTIECMSIDSILSILKRALHGPTSWMAMSRRSEPAQAPSPVHRITLRPGDHKYFGARLVGDGQYIILRRSTLECWNITENHLVWEYQPHEIYPDLTGFNGLVYGQETLERGKVVNLMVCFTSPHSKHFIEIIRLDLLTGQSTLLRSMQAPRRVHTYKFYRPTICGDWAVVILTFARASFLLNWKTGQHAELPLNELGRSTMDVALIPGHLFTLTTEHNRTYVSVWNSSSFDWQEGPARSRLSNPRPLVEYDLELPDGRTAQQRQIFAFAHPLHDRAYVIWAYANSAVPWLAGGPTGSSIAVKYNIYLSDSQSPRREDVWWKRGNLSITKAPKVSILPQGFPIIGWCGVSFSGHTLVGTSTTPRPLVSIVSLGQLSNYEETAGTGEFPNAHHLSPYSGTLSSIWDDVVTVDYYD